MAVSLLVGSAIRREIKKLMQKEGEAAVAVAYWGDGAAKSTGVLDRKRERTRILCDLFSGFCNPKEMRKLIIHAEVRTLDGLHAKVWCTFDQVVIGSANASANGMGEEGKDTTENIEACTLVEDRKFAKDVQAWFEKTWQNRQCLPVDGNLVDEAESIWRERRSRRHRQVSTTLTEALKQPGAEVRFKNVRILAYRRAAVTKEQQAVADKVFKLHYSPQQLEAWQGYYPFYFHQKGWKVSPGVIYLDFEVPPRGAKKFGFFGIYQVRKEPHLEVEGKKLILCDPLLDLTGVRLTEAEQGALCSEILNRVEKNGWKMDKNSNYIDLPLTKFVSSRQLAE